MVSAVSGVAGSVRVAQLTRAGITRAQKHGKRQDATGQARVVRKAEALTRTGLEVSEQFEAHVADTFIPQAKTKAMHLLIQFPKDLVDPSDAEGMLDHARAFCERVFGPDAIFADRIDLDERNTQVVDVFVAPKYLKVTKRESKVAVSMTKHLKELAKRHKQPPLPYGMGRALQTELYQYFRDVMKLEGVQRGEAKVFAGSDWKSAEEQRLEELEGQKAEFGELVNKAGNTYDAVRQREEEVERDEQRLAAARTALAEERERLELDAAELQAGLISLERSQAELAVDESALHIHRGHVALEEAQAKLLLRAADDDEGLELTIFETGKPKMNEAAMNPAECMAYRATWSERMLELARFVANALLAMRARIAAVVKRERAAQVREANALLTRDAAQQRLDAASAAEERVTEAKAVADKFMVAWQRIPEDQRSPLVREALTKAEALVTPEKVPPTAPGAAGTPKSAAEGIAALRALTRGPNDGRAEQLGGLSPPSGRDGASR